MLRWLGPPRHFLAHRFMYELRRLFLPSEVGPPMAVAWVLAFVPASRAVRGVGLRRCSTKSSTGSWYSQLAAFEAAPRIPRL